MRVLALKNDSGQEIQVFRSQVWFLDFGLCLTDRYNVNEATEAVATTIQDVFKCVAEKYGVRWAVDPPTMKSVKSMQLTPAQRGFFVKVKGRDLLPCKSTMTRGEIVEAAKTFGLLDCPCDTPLFTHMQTRDLLHPGGELGEVLLFPSYSFKWEKRNSLWGMHVPLDFTNLAWFEDEQRPEGKGRYEEKRYSPNQKWAFEINPEAINPKAITWENNRRSF